jgi:hypothetical protein
MLVPFMIFLMILSPVLIPAAVTIVNVMQGNHRPAGAAASRRFFAVPAAACGPPPPGGAPPKRGGPRLVYGASGCRTAAPYQ